MSKTEKYGAYWKYIVSFDVQLWVKIKFQKNYCNEKTEDKKRGKNASNTES